MNTNMYENPATQENLSVLRQRGYIVMEPLSGHLACGAVGKGKMPEPDDIYDRIEAILACQKDLRGLRILVTAGPTQEPLDPVRYLTNHSSGKMGYAIAHAAMLRGADVTLVSGPTALKYPPLVRTIPIVTAQDMYEAVTREAEHADIIIKAAAVADYTPETVADNKIKKSDSDLSILCAGPRIFWAIWAPIAVPVSSSAAFPWKPNTCWKTAGRSSAKRIWT